MKGDTLHTGKHSLKPQTIKNKNNRSPGRRCGVTPHGLLLMGLITPHGLVLMGLTAHAGDTTSFVTN